VHARRKARKNFYQRPTPLNKRLYSQTTQEAKTTVESAKKESWAKFLSCINPQTPLSTVWKMFRAVSGKLPTAAIPLTLDNAPLSPEETAETLAAHFATTLAHPSSIPAEKMNVISMALECEDNSTYNRRFSLWELKRGIHRLRTRSAPGSDLIHNSFIFHLPNTHHSAVLALFNQSFQYVRSAA
jgi:hypothetical protein